jgi:hypothetical protein
MLVRGQKPAPIRRTDSLIPPTTVGDVPRLPGESRTYS